MALILALFPDVACQHGDILTFTAVYRWSPTLLYQETFKEGYSEASPNYITMLAQARETFTLHNFAPTYGGQYRHSTEEEGNNAGLIPFEMVFCFQLSIRYVFSVIHFGT